MAQWHVSRRKDDAHVMPFVQCRHLKRSTSPTKLLLPHLLDIGKIGKEFQEKVNFYPEKLNLCSHSFMS